MMKRFLYLFQVEQDLPPSLQGVEGPESDILFVSWRHRSTDPRSRFYPSSSWTQGRNRLWREAVDLDYDYFIFADDDLKLELTELGRRRNGTAANPWRVFEEFLGEWEPAIGCCAYDWHLIGGGFDPRQDCQTLRFFDALLNAFHREALGVLLPYYDLMDEESECYSQNLLCSLASELYPGHVMQTNRVHVANTQQRRADYQYLLLSRPENLFLEMLRDPAQGRGFLRQQVQDSARHPTMGPPHSKAGTYVVSDQELARRFRLDHRFWRRKRELADLPKDAEFFSEDPESMRARHWRSHRPLRQLPPSPKATPPTAPRPFFAMRSIFDPMTAARNLLRRRPELRGNPMVRFAQSLVRGNALAYFWQMIICGMESRRRARGFWRKWARDTTCCYEIPEDRQAETIYLLASALNDLSTDRVVLVDVGAGCGDYLTRLSAGAGLVKPLRSIGIDPIETRGHRAYSGFVLGAITDGPEGSADFYRYASLDCSSLKRMDPACVTHNREEGGAEKYFSAVEIEKLEETLTVPTFNLSTIIRQYGLAGEVLHVLKIDAQGSDLDVFRSLGEFTPNCLFLQIESVLPEGDNLGVTLYEGQTTFREDHEVIEAAGFRLFNVARFGVTPEADLLYVNLSLFRKLLPQLAD